MSKGGENAAVQGEEVKDGSEASKKATNESFQEHSRSSTASVQDSRKDQR